MLEWIADVLEDVAIAIRRATEKGPPEPVRQRLQSARPFTQAELETIDGYVEAKKTGKRHHDRWKKMEKGCLARSSSYCVFGSAPLYFCNETYCVRMWEPKK